VLASDGADLAAAIQTIKEIGDSEALDQAVADAFDGANVTMISRDGWFKIGLR
jgi:predicted ATPase